MDATDIAPIIIKKVRKGGHGHHGGFGHHGWGHRHGGWGHRWGYRRFGYVGYGGCYLRRAINDFGEVILVRRCY